MKPDRTDLIPQISYLIFLVIFSYTVLVRTEPDLTWQEYYVTLYIISIGCEKVAEFASSEPVSLSHKYSVWAWNMWNPCDAVAITIFIIALGLRLRPSSMDIGHVIFCINIMYWYLRILNILGVNKYLGPLITMMGKMIKSTIYFLVLVLVVLLSFGVCHQSILVQDSPFNWTSVRDVVYHPYFMIQGEVYDDLINPDCGDSPDLSPCETGRWIAPLAQAMYHLTANILLVNLLIAVFNNIYFEVNAVSHQVWTFQRFKVVMEYEQKPVLPPPFVLLSHLILLIQYCRRKFQGVPETYDNALKLFLNSNDLERLTYFETRCAEGYFREKETKLNMSSDQQITNTAEQVEVMYQQVEDLNQRENSQTSSFQNVELRLQKLEALTEQNQLKLPIILKFMSTYTKNQLNPAEQTVITQKKGHKMLLQERLKHETLEQYEALRLLMSERDHNISRRRPSRSLTEERPNNLRLNDDLPLKIDNNDSTKLPSSLGETADQFWEAQEEKDSLAFEDKSVLGKNKMKKFQDGSKTNDKSYSRNQLLEGEKVLIGPLVTLLPDIRPRERKRDIHTTKHYEVGCEDSLTQSPSSYRFLRRQRSQTYSGPETLTEDEESEDEGKFTADIMVAWADSKLKNKEPSRNPLSMFSTVHSEYTSITDELETTVCSLLGPPNTPHRLSKPRPSQSLRGKRHHSEMSSPEMALYLEKEHLRDAEDNDYHLMERLIQRHCEDESTDNAFYLGVGDSPEFQNQGRSLRRESAVEMPSPTVGAQQQQGPAIFCTDTDTQQVKPLRTPQPNKDKTL